MESNIDIKIEQTENPVNCNINEETLLDESARITCLSDTSNQENKNLNDQLNLSDLSSCHSKKQLKRLQKLQKRVKMHVEWKLKRKLKNKERKIRNKILSLNLEKPKITTMSSSTRKFTVVIDFSYDELMNQKDLIKCGNQVTRCYSVNRRSLNPIQLHFCNFTGKIETEIGKNNGYKKWDIYFHENSYLDVFNKSDLVYLTSESKNILETLEENKIYIIGGLVDHNAYKGISYQKAVHEDISHAQLPIKKYVQMKSRSVLTINHVFEILLKVSNGESWSKTLMSAIPPRFFENYFTSKCTTNNNDSENSDNEEPAAGDIKANENQKSVLNSSSEINMDVKIIE